METDLGTWQVYETPGHAPSHVVLHQPERKLMISGDHLLGRTVLFFDHGHSPDPIGEFLGSLDRVEPLEVDLCLPGHGRPFRDPEAKIAEARRQVDELLEKIREALGEGERTAFEIVAEIVGAENVNTPVSAWVLQIVLSCLDHMAILEEVEKVDGTDPQRWRLEVEGRSRPPCPACSLPPMASFTFTREVAAPPETVFAVLTDHRRYADMTRCASRSSSARESRRPTESVRFAGLTAVGPATARGGHRLRAGRALLLQAALRSAGARSRRHGELTAAGGGTEMVYAVRTSRPCRWSAAIVVAVLKQAVKGLVDGVVKESERRAAAGG